VFDGFLCIYFAHTTGWPLLRKLINSYSRIRYFQSVCIALSEITAVELTNTARSGGDQTASTILARKHLRNDNFGRFKSRDKKYFKTQYWESKLQSWEMDGTDTVFSFVVSAADPVSSQKKVNYCFSFILLACEECDDSLPFSTDSFIPLCYIIFPTTFLPQLFFHPPSLHLDLPLGLVDSKFICNALLGILFSSILCTCPNQRNLYWLCYGRFFNNRINLFISSYILQFSFSFSYIGPRILPYTFLSKMFNCFLYLFVTVFI
jgi:hypothetical protein